MIDALFKPHMDRLWAPLGRGAARLGLTPNAVTALSVLLCAANAGAYAHHGRGPLFAIGLLLFEALDNVDGALARATQRCTAFGSYLDAVADRYKDAMAFMAVGTVTQQWLACAAGMSGAMLVSYTQARAQAEQAGALEVLEAPRTGGTRSRLGVLERRSVPTNATLPFGDRPVLARSPWGIPLFERLERVLLLAAGLLFSGTPGVLTAALWAGAALAHLTALQRIHAASRALAS